MKVKNFSDLNGWNIEDKKIYNGNKTLDLQLGYKVIDLLEKYNLGIISVEPGKWLNDNRLLLPDEKNFQEYRVHISKKLEWDDFLDNEGYDYDEMSEEEQEKIKEEYKKLEFMSDPLIEFSVFLPNGITDKQAAALSDASIYLKNLSDSNLINIIECKADYNVFFDNTNEFKKFINLKTIKITNDNLEDIKTINHRLYKDSKAFYLFIENIGEYKSKKLFNEWLNLIK